MASSVTAVQGERFEFFFPLPRVPSGTRVTAYFKRGDQEIKTSDCGSRLGGGFWCYRDKCPMMRRREIMFSFG
ncbi:MAG: hypothetical protein WBE30_02320 [Candidatus Cybelea sp.]